MYHAHFPSLVFLFYPSIPLGRIQIPPRALSFKRTLCDIMCFPRDQWGASDWTKRL